MEKLHKITNYDSFASFNFSLKPHENLNPKMLLLLLLIHRLNPAVAQVKGRNSSISYP